MSEADLELICSSHEDEDEVVAPVVQDENASPTIEMNEEDIPVEDEEKEKEKEELPEYFQQCVFLKSGEFGHSPHTLHCLLLDKATVLIIISQVFFFCI